MATYQPALIVCLYYVLYAAFHCCGTRPQEVMQYPELALIFHTMLMSSGYHCGAWTNQRVIHMSNYEEGLGRVIYVEGALEHERPFMALCTGSCPFSHEARSEQFLRVSFFLKLSHSTDTSDNTSVRRCSGTKHQDRTRWTASLLTVRRHSRHKQVSVCTGVKSGGCTRRVSNPLS